MRALDQLRAELRSTEAVLAAEPGESKRRELLGECEYLREAIAFQERIEARFGESEVAHG